MATGITNLPTDHPRLRGGNLTAWRHAFPREGSSPLARGKLRRVMGPAGAIRIIPACAGETPSWGSSSCSPRDHPRLRGGNDDLWTTVGEPVGSSPLARGKHDRDLRGGCEGRIIPACAGETFRRAPRRLSTGDHPRLRGGNGSRYLPALTEKGSSPLARGKLVLHPRELHQLGIIPACAGETLGDRWSPNGVVT